MTTDPFTIAAQESAERAHPGHRTALPGDAVLGLVDAHIAGAEWARDHLAAHFRLTLESEAVTVESDEPTDAEVLAAAWAICRLQDDGYEPTEGLPCGACTESARAALSAARAARRDEGKQDG